MITQAQAQQFTDRTLIESILSSYFIVDYGFINEVNDDETVNVTHAKKQVLLDGTELPTIETPNLEVLTISGAGFSMKFDYKAGDKVLLLGLKDYVKNVADVSQAETPTTFIHYSRSTMKALPLCAFNDEAKVKVQVENGQMTISTEDKILLDGDDNGGLVICPELATQLGYMKTRIDTIINALKNSATAAQDGGATYKANIVLALAQIVNVEDFSNIESEKVFHGTGE